MFKFNTIEGQRKLYTRVIILHESTLDHVSTSYIIKVALNKVTIVITRTECQVEVTYMYIYYLYLPTRS